MDGDLLILCSIEFCCKRLLFSLYLEIGVQWPVFFRNKRCDLIFPVCNDAKCHRLHTTGTKSSFYFCPENRTDLISHDTIQHTTRLLRIYQIHVDITCIFQGCLYRTFSDLVKTDPVYFLSFQLKCFHQVPGNCFSFAVRVSCKINLICFFYFFSKSCKDLTFSSDCNVFRLKVMLQVYSHLTFRQISYMSVWCHYHVIAAEKFLYGLHFCRWLYNHKITCHILYSSILIVSDHLALT